MKKIFLLVLVFISFSCMAQKPKVQVVKYKSVTTTERDAFTVPSGEYWRIFNSTNVRNEFWDGDSWEVLGGGSSYLPINSFTVGAKVGSVSGLSVAINEITFGFVGADVTNILFDEEYSNYLVRLNDLIATRDLYIKVFNKSKNKTLVSKIIGFTENVVSTVSYWSVSLLVGDMLSANIDVLDTVEVEISVSSISAGATDLTNYVTLDGNQTIVGDKFFQGIVEIDNGSEGVNAGLGMSNHKIQFLADGVIASDAVNKGQLDTAVSGLALSSSIAVTDSQFVIGTGTGIEGTALIKTAETDKVVDIKPFSGATLNSQTMSSGTIRFANGSGTGEAPVLAMKTDDNLPALTVTALATNTNTNGDFFFDVRENNGTDFETLTGTAFVFSRFGNSLMNIRRDGFTTFLGSVVASNLSGDNTGDNEPNTLYSGLGADITTNTNNINTNTSNIGTNTSDITSLEAEQIVQNDAIALNTAKNTNVTTNLSVGTRTATTMNVNSSDGGDAILPEANTSQAGLLGADKWDEIVANTNKTSNIAHPTVLKSVPADALFTDTVYNDTDVLKDSDAVTLVTGINKLITQSDVAGLGGGDMLKSVYDADGNSIVDNTELVNGFTIQKAVPSNALFTDTVYDDTTIQAEVTDNTAKVGITPTQASNIVTNNGKISNISHPLVETAVPIGALFTDTVFDDSNVLLDTDALTAVTGINKLITQSDISSLGGGDMLKSTYDTNANSVVDNSELVNGLTVQTAVPIGALFTDTPYNDTTIQAEVDVNSGKRTYPLVDETKLLGIEVGATADQDLSSFLTSASLNNYVQKTETDNVDFIGNQWFRLRDGNASINYSEITPKYFKTGTQYSSYHSGTYSEKSIQWQGTGSLLTLDGNTLANQGTFTSKIPYGTGYLALSVNGNLASLNGDITVPDKTPTELLSAIRAVDGIGSALDADTLDGVDSSSFLRSDATDTATGNLNFGNITITDEAIFQGDLLIENISGIDMQGTHITSLQNGVLSGDAVNKGQLDAKTSIADNQIVVGTGTGVEGASKLKFDGSAFHYDYSFTDTYIGDLVGYTGGVHNSAYNQGTSSLNGSSILLYKGTMGANIGAYRAGLSGSQILQFADLTDTSTYVINVPQDSGTMALTNQNWYAPNEVEVGTQNSSSGSSQLRYGKLTLFGGYGGQGIEMGYRDSSFTTTLDRAFITANNTVTLPTTSGNIPLKESTNAWSGGNDFTNSVNLNGDTTIGGYFEIDNTNGIDMYGGTINNLGAGVASSDAVNKGQLDAQLAVTRPYKVYTALITQYGLTNPVATVLENTLGGTITWVKNSIGVYIGNCSITGFTTDKTVAFIQHNNDAAYAQGTNTVFYSFDSRTTGTCRLEAINQSGTGVDSTLKSASIEIRVYN